MSGWQNRIVAYKVIAHADLGDLNYHPDNWREHPPEQTEALVGVLESVGWVTGVIVNARTGNLIDGHERVEEADRSGQDVPAVFVDLSEEEERTILATLDPIGALAITNKSKLAALVSDIQTPNSTIAQMLDNLVNGTGIVVPSFRDMQDGAALPAAAPQQEPQTKSERFVEIRLTQAALDAIAETLDEWSGMRGIEAVNIS